MLEVSSFMPTMTMSNSMFRLQSSTASPLAREITLPLHGQESGLPIVDARHHPIIKQKGVRPTTACNYCNTSGNSGQKNYNAFVNLKLINKLKLLYVSLLEAATLYCTCLLEQSNGSVSESNKMREADVAKEKNFKSTFLYTHFWLWPISC